MGFMTLKIQDGGHTPSRKSSWRPIWIKFRRLVQDMSTAVIWWKSKPEVKVQYGGRLGAFKGMSSQSHVSHSIRHIFLFSYCSLGAGSFQSNSWLGWY